MSFLSYLKKLLRRQAPRNVLLAYVEGSDLESIAASLERRFAEFVVNREWSAKEVIVVNRRDPAVELQPGELAQWDLGLNFTIPDKKDRDDRWIADVRATVDFLSILNGDFERDFVIAVHDRIRGYNEDVAFVESEPPDLKKIVFMIDAHRG